MGVQVHHPQGLDTGEATHELTDEERTELDDLQGFVELLGASEMSDARWDRYIDLLRRASMKRDDSIDWLTAWIWAACFGSGLMALLCLTFAILPGHDGQTVFAGVSSAALLLSAAATLWVVSREVPDE